MIASTDRQHLGRRAAEAADLFPLAPQEMGEIGRSLEMPAFAALD